VRCGGRGRGFCVYVASGGLGGCVAVDERWLEAAAFARMSWGDHSLCWALRRKI